MKSITLHPQQTDNKKSPTERIFEYSFPSGKGGLMCLHVDSRGRERVELYRHDAGIHFLIGKDDKGEGTLTRVDGPYTTHRCYITMAIGNDPSNVIPLLDGMATAPNAADYMHPYLPTATYTSSKPDGESRYLLTWETTNQYWNALLAHMLGSRLILAIEPA
jgi:hypothetical protein